MPRHMANSCFSHPENVSLAQSSGIKVSCSHLCDTVGLWWFQNSAHVSQTSLSCTQKEVQCCPRWALSGTFILPSVPKAFRKMLVSSSKFLAFMSLLPLGNFQGAAPKTAQVWRTTRYSTKGVQHRWTAAQLKNWHFKQSLSSYIYAHAEESPQEFTGPRKSP